MHTTIVKDSNLDLQNCPYGSFISSESVKLSNRENHFMTIYISTVYEKETWKTGYELILSLTDLLN